MEDRLYDLIFICRPDTPEEEVDKLVANLQQTVTERQGRVEKLEKWGTRKMAYRVDKHREGYYVYLSLHGTQADMIKELERRLKVTDSVIKYLTIRLDEELKRQRKLQGHRERRAARRPRKGAAAPAGEQAAAS
jgi:small subunit ribosomal protein S6